MIQRTGSIALKKQSSYCMGGDNQCLLELSAFMAPGPCFDDPVAPTRGQ